MHVNPTAFKTGIMLTLKSQYQVSHIQLLAVEIEKTIDFRVSNLSGMMEEAAARNQVCVCVCVLFYII